MQLILAAGSELHYSIIVWSLLLLKQIIQYIVQYTQSFTALLQILVTKQVQGCKNCNPFTGLFSGLTAISNILNISEFSNVKEWAMTDKITKDLQYESCQAQLFPIKLKITFWKFHVNIITNRW